jgi:sugar phosphate permease
MSLIVVYAKDVLDLGPIGLGYITALRQFGGVIGLILLASLGDFQRKGLLMFIITILFGLGQIVVYGFEGVVFYATMLFFLNACAMSVDTLYKTLMQLNVPNHQRGTAMGSWVLSIGTGPIGHLGAGFMASVYNAPTAMMINGIILTLAGICTCLSLPKIRRLT